VIELTIIHQSDVWDEVPLLCKPVIELTFAQAAIDGKNKAIAVVFSDDEQVRELNREFRDKDAPTNVLSFEQEPNDEEWGDIIFAYETILREAQEQGKDFSHHLTHLLVHGTLHLLGYDHTEDEEAEAMEALEIHILSKLGIDNPYQKE